ncbi:MAG: putative manganese-dependent inorganic diphosphatase [Bacilli bacterium]|nr:putative manganese-dependent inorganic diphosphatase [Bacilli bacterium]
MDKTFIFGHKKPDTDSVTSAINLSYLKNKLGYNTVPVVLGEINNETKFVLDYFKVKVPHYLNDVKLQIKDINFQKDYFINKKESIYNGYLYMNKNIISTLPIVDDNKKFVGMVSMKDIAKDQVSGNMYNLDTSYQNIIDTLNGNQILKYDDEIKGHMIVASFKSTTFIENIKITKDTILIVGDRHSIIEYAASEGAKLIIITGGRDIKDDHLQLAKNNHVNIIKTSYDTFKVSKIINLCNYIFSIAIKNDIICFNENEDINDFISISNKYKYSSYPIINKKEECLGILRVSDIVNKKRKKVILVDHNEYEQSVDGLDEAEIVEIVDHHKIGSISTSLPISFRNMPVGSTNTIIYNIYRENNIDIPYETAGLMLSGIISDTLLLTSPTTTNIDKAVVDDLINILNIDYIDYGKEMFKAGSSLKGKTKEQIMYGDFKNFTIDNKKVGVGQINSMNINEILDEKNDYVKLINDIAKQNDYYVFTFFITDILDGGSYILFNDNSKDILDNGFDVSNIYQGYYLKGLVSRKKQFIPAIMRAMEKR